MASTSLGKKKITTQTEQDALKEEAVLSSAQKKAGSAPPQFRSGRVEKARVHIQSSYNNTVLTVSDWRGDVFAHASSGSLGFRGPKKATPYAASKVVEAVMDKVRKAGVKEVTVFVKGIGSGREAAIRALASHGLEIDSIKDITPIPHNGCRPRKVRRV